MNILLLTPELFLADGGIARIMRLYLKAACELCGPGGRVDSLVLNDQPGRDPRLARYANERLGEQLGCAGGKLRFITQAVGLARRADLLICGHLHHLPVAQLARRFNPRLRYYLVAHGIEVWRPYTWLERRALLGAHRILCVSEYTRRQMLRFLPALAPERVVVVPNALDPQFSPDRTRALSPQPFAGPRILTVSRLTVADNYKGIDTLIEAMPLIRRQHPFAQLRVVGQGDDLPRLRNLAASLGVAGAVEFTGPLDDEALRTEYATCDFFALPSRREGFGLVFLEAMAHGKPCIGADAGGTPEVIDHSCGCLVPYANRSALVAACTTVFAATWNAKDIKERTCHRFGFETFQKNLGPVLSS